MKTVNLELSKQLKEAGYPQESAEHEYCGGHVWYHDDQIEGKFEECGSTDLLGKDQYCNKEELTCEYFIASPTADEILDKLPEHVGEILKKGSGGLTISKYKDEYAVWYCSAKDRTSLFGPTLTHFGTLADAAAQMWLYLKKEGLLEEERIR